jgi:hypothetical protein
VVEECSTKFFATKVLLYIESYYPRTYGT